MRQIELAFLDYLQSWHSPPLNAFFKGITFLSDYGVVWILCALTLLFFKKTRRCALLMLCTLVLGYLLCNLTIKELVARPRPYVYSPSVNMIIPAPEGYAFPSAHTMSSFAMATLLFLYNKRIGIGAFVLAFFVAFSRLYMYVHFPSDVVCGALIGVALALVTYKTAQLITKRRKGRKKLRNK